MCPQRVPAHVAYCASESGSEHRAGHILIVKLRLARPYLLLCWNLRPANAWGSETAADAFLRRPKSTTNPRLRPTKWQSSRKSSSRARSISFARTITDRVTCGLIRDAPQVCGSHAAGSTGSSLSFVLRASASDCADNPEGEHNLNLYRNMSMFLLLFGVQLEHSQKRRRGR
jgi:hypothetical protein